MPSSPPRTADTLHATPHHVADPVEPKLSALRRATGGGVGGGVSSGGSGTGNGGSDAARDDLIISMPPPPTSRFTSTFSRRGSAGNVGSSTTGGERSRGATTVNDMVRAERERSQLLRSISHLGKDQRPPSTATQQDEESAEWLRSAGLSTAHILPPPIPVAPLSSSSPRPEHSPPSSSRPSFTQLRNRAQSTGFSGDQTQSGQAVDPSSTSSSAAASPTSRRSFSRSVRPSWVLSSNPSSESGPRQAKRKASMPQIGKLASAFRSREALASASDAQPTPTGLERSGSSPGRDSQSPARTSPVNSTSERWPSNPDAASASMSRGSSASTSVPSAYDNQQHRRNASTSSNVSESQGSLGSPTFNRTPGRISFDLGSAQNRASSRRPSLAPLAASQPLIEDGLEDSLDVPNYPGCPGAFSNRAARNRTGFMQDGVVGAEENGAGLGESTSEGRRSSHLEGEEGVPSQSSRMSKVKKWANRSTSNLLSTEGAITPRAIRSSMDMLSGSEVRPDTKDRSRRQSFGRKSLNLFRSKVPQQDAADQDARSGRSSAKKADASQATSASLQAGNWIKSVLASSSRRKSAAPTTSVSQDDPAVEDEAENAAADADEAQRNFDSAFGPVQSSERNSTQSPDAGNQHAVGQPGIVWQNGYGEGGQVPASTMAPAQSDRSAVDALDGPDPSRSSSTNGDRGSRPKSVGAHSQTSEASSASPGQSGPNSHQSSASVQSQQTELTTPSVQDHLANDNTALPSAHGRNLCSAAGDHAASESDNGSIGLPDSESTTVDGQQFSDAREVLTPLDTSIDTIAPPQIASQGTSANPRPIAGAAPSSRSSRPRGHLSQMPRLNSTRLFESARGNNKGGTSGGGDSDDDSQRPGGNASGSGSGGGGGGDDGRRDGSRSSGEESQELSEDDGSETDTDGEEEEPSRTSAEGVDRSELPALSSSASGPRPFIAPIPMPPGDSLGDSSANTFSASNERTASERAARPGGIQLPPRPTFNESTQAAAAPNSVPSPDRGQGGAHIGRASWTKFGGTPFETPTPTPAATFSSAASSQRTPGMSSGENSYFTQRPAPARTANGMAQGDNAPPPSPSVITRNRAPSSASTRTLRMGAAGRELPPMPAVRPLQFRGNSIMDVPPAASTSGSRARASTAMSPTSSLDQPRSSPLSQTAAGTSPKANELTTSRPATASENSTSSPQNAKARQATEPHVSSPQPMAMSPVATAEGSTRSGGLRPSLYQQQSRSLIDLPSSSRQSSTSFDAASTLASGAKSRQDGQNAATSGGASNDWMLKPPPTPIGGPPLIGSAASAASSPRQRRRSMIEMAATPPPYAIIHRRPEGPQMIFPREDEGTERLPRYTCTVHIEGYLPRKMEFSSPGVQAKDRAWKRQYFVLHGTCLRVYRTDLSSAGGSAQGASGASRAQKQWGEMSGVHVHPDPLNEDGSNGGIGSTPGAALIESLQNSSLLSGAHGGVQSDKSGLVRNYSLQGAESGLAADYFKRRHVVRVRAEGEQFLLQTVNDRHVVDWIEALQAATNVSTDLERRQMPKFITLPRRRRRRGANGPASAAARQDARARENRELMEAQRRSLADAEGNSGRNDGGGGVPRPGSRPSGDNSPPDSSARMDEMLREEHEAMSRPAQSESVV